jgi:hypothetical protein
VAVVRELQEQFLAREEELTLHEEGLMAREVTIEVLEQPACCSMPSGPRSSPQRRTVVRGFENTRLA